MAKEDACAPALSTAHGTAIFPLCWDGLARAMRSRDAVQLSRGTVAVLALGIAVLALGDVACTTAAPRANAEAPAAGNGNGNAGVVPVDNNADDDVDGVPTGAPSGPIGTSGNHGIKVFDEAKKELGRIYAAASQHIDLYCGCTFLASPGHGMRVDLTSCGYVPARDAARAERIEWEHAVPAAAFGHTFAEWREGHPKCVDAKGKRFRGRKCARMASAEFARIEADLHNLFPVVGEVNGLRADFPMGVGNSSGGTFHFGACQSAIERGVFMPRPEVRGDLARAYKYMDKSYPERSLIDDVHRAVFDAWDKGDPPDAWERDRNKRIAARQGNSNTFIGD
jgi:deoxyribonuclease-1